jgi:hypothetical protein
MQSSAGQQAQQRASHDPQDRPVTLLVQVAQSRSQEQVRSATCLFRYFSEAAGAHMWCENVPVWLGPLTKPMPATL